MSDVYHDADIQREREREREREIKKKILGPKNQVRLRKSKTKK